MIGLVLLVDDDPLVLRLNSAVVRSFGFQTILAETVDEAIHLVGTNKCSLVISDVQMPGGGGFDLVRRLKEGGLKTMPVVFLTGYDDLDVLRGGLSAGGDDIMIKGRPVEWIRERIAFWTASGFQNIPAEMARRAIGAANRMKGDEFIGIERALRRREGLSVGVLSQLAEELTACPARYGLRMIERVCFIARATRLIFAELDSVGDYVRFPDYLYFTVNALAPVWQNELPVLLKEFDNWSRDERFLTAANQPLKAFDAYEWNS